MLVRCPSCHSKAIIRASDQWTENTRIIYCQCKNINCSTTFKGQITVEEIIRSPSEGSTPPDAAKQPDLVDNPNQIDLLQEIDHQECVS
ncbi:MAG: hypothetical protein DSZ27_07300 [Thiomicrospira sp.]|nr:MAG: hypothetical protein DSZ27_07300 [Thiomicrospira sp.]